MEARFDIELLYMPEEEGQPLSSRIDLGGINSNLVGLSDEFERLRDFLLQEGGGEDEDEDEGNCLLVTGMAGWQGLERQLLLREYLTIHQFRDILSFKHGSKWAENVNPMKRFGAF